MQDVFFTQKTMFQNKFLSDFLIYVIYNFVSFDPVERFESGCNVLWFYVSRMLWSPDVMYPDVMYPNVLYTTFCLRTLCTEYLYNSWLYHLGCIGWIVGDFGPIVWGCLELMVCVIGWECCCSLIGEGEVAHGSLAKGCSNLFWGSDGTELIALNM